MANSKSARPMGTTTETDPLGNFAPARTPGPLGRNDAGDPTAESQIGDTPGSLGNNDHASPEIVSAAGLATGGGAKKYPPGDKDAVIKQAEEFLAKEERVMPHPYWPGGNSGITLGVGWDAGMHTEAQIRETWAALDDDDLDALAKTANKHGLNAKALLKDVKDIDIPREVSIAVFKKDVPKYYQQAAHAFPGMTRLPAGVQVALISLVYNRGASMHKKGEKWVLDSRWEIRNIKSAVQRYDLVDIYDELDYMKRLWKGTDIEGGMAARRNHERALVLPYVRDEIEEQKLWSDFMMGRT